ncbi:MAG: hypothetical protein Q8941_14955 [Bacteroidota bacterium]|nr:hypothetical protein [Bacteroidota bacterium]
MEQTEQNNLFEIKLNAEGKLYIRNFAGIVRVIILISIALSLLHIVSAIIEAIWMRPLNYRGV